MNLLVTNARTAQAYCIMQCLRPQARKIVAETYGHSALAARISPAANSRLVDRRCRVPYPTRDWQSGRIQRENTEAEERYLQAILQVCEREQIDTIFPSHDAQVYIFAKNADRLRARGLFVPVPDLDTLLGALDKYRTLQAAAAAGFPHPRTLLADHDDAVAAFAREVKPPWVVRPRFTAGSLGMEIISDRNQLLPRARAIRAAYGVPILQEYIEGGGRQNFYLVVGPSSEPVFGLCPKVLRTSARVFRTNTAAAESAVDHPQLAAAFALARQLRWRGTLTVQTKIDPRTGRPCLMEANPRLGTHLWYRTALGVNEPDLCLRIARGEAVPPVTGVPAGTLLLEPIEDLASFGFEALDRLLYLARTKVLGRAPLDPASPPPGLAALVRGYTTSYRSRQPKVYSPLSACWRSDPLVALLWSYTAFRSWTRHVDKLGV